LLALLTVNPKNSSAQPSKKPVSTAHEQRLKRTEKQLNKLLKKSSDTLNMSQLYLLVDAMAKQEERKTEKAVQIGGQTFTTFYKDQ
jgi:hypothetical protein